MSLLNRYFTIGMAGHIDHGKTSLTKALTGVSTDSLKEEQTRKISIEPGFAPFIHEEDLEVSIIDVPGHENFIRQMIAGVAGIDLVTVVIAADEGIMPQTKEHLAILSLLGINNGVIVITKTSLADEELLEIILEDIKSTVKDTFLKNAPIFFVDSLSQKGIPELKNALKEIVSNMPIKHSNVPFRLPIDHVFTIKGQGTIVRGTIYNGNVQAEQQLTLLPKKLETRVKQLQIHGKKTEIAYKGQRTAINLSGVSHQDISRGDVLVEDDFFTVSKRIDIVFQPLNSIKHAIKQRQAIKLHIGTQEVMGKIIFFDRNIINKDETAEVLCQLEVNEDIVAVRGDHFILRRPTPTETIGGGWVINAQAKKLKFGESTVNQLQIKKAGSPTDRLESIMREHITLSETEILNLAAISYEELSEIKHILLELEKNQYALISIIEETQNHILSLIENYHNSFPMRQGINKAEIISELTTKYPLRILEVAINRLKNNKDIDINEQYISLNTFTPHLPSEWQKRLVKIEEDLISEGAETNKWDHLLASSNIPSIIQTDFYYYLIQTKRAFVLDDERLISRLAVVEAITKLKEHTQSEDFTLQMAREALELSRKNLVPLLELLDKLGYTERVENTRRWINK